MNSIRHIKCLGQVVILLMFFIVYACSKSNDETDIVKEADTVPEKMVLPEESEIDHLYNAFDFVGASDNLETAIEILESVNDEEIKAMLSNTTDTLTLFVPSDEAFSTFLATLDSYESIEDFDEQVEKELLSKILKYHIIEGTAIFSDGLSDGKVLTSQQSETFQVLVDGDVYLQDATMIDAKITRADNEVSNGVVHIIDKVLLPNAILQNLFYKPTLLELIEQTEELSSFQEALTKADLYGVLEGEEEITLFAPTNAAVEQLFVLLGDDYNTFEDFKNSIELQILEEILLGHMVNTKITSQDLLATTLPTLLPNDSIELIAAGDTFVIKDASITNANFISFDLEASNGIIHLIDKILIPQKALVFVE